MDLPTQKNFYDQKRYFQGKDQPNDAHPAPVAREPVPIGQVVFGLVFLLFIGLLFVLNTRGEEPPTTTAKAAATSPPAPSKK